MEPKSFSIDLTDVALSDHIKHLYHCIDVCDETMAEQRTHNMPTLAMITEAKKHAFFLALCNAEDCMQKHKKVEAEMISKAEKNRNEKPEVHHAP